MTPIEKMKNELVTLVGEYIFLTHRYRLSNSASDWDKLSEVEEEVENLRLSIFRVDKSFKVYSNNKPITNIYS